MELSCFSNVLLDGEGHFSYQKLFQAFCEIAAQQQRPYPGLANCNLVQYAPPNNTQQQYLEQPQPLQLPGNSNIFSQQHHSSLKSSDDAFMQQRRLPIAAPAGAVSTPYSPLNFPAASSREEQLEAISDDEDDYEEDDSESQANQARSSEHQEFAHPSTSVESLRPSSMPFYHASSDVPDMGSFSPGTVSPMTPHFLATPPIVRRRPQHRLKLVLDLDNTLLHAIARSKIGSIDVQLSHFLDSDGLPELYKFVLPQLLTQTYYIKLRPGLRRFLRDVSEYCDLAIHTNATREYADVVIAILDPDRSLFRGRVAAREDETAKDHKKNMDRLFGIDDLDVRSLLILDDRIDVWDEAFHPNIIQCGMYEYLENRKAALIARYQVDSTTTDASSTTRLAEQPAKQTGDGGGPNGSTLTGVPNTAGVPNMPSSPSSESRVARTGDDGYQMTPNPSPCPSSKHQDSDDSDSSPFLDNPLISLTSSEFTTTADDEDCEDDDLILTPTSAAENATNQQRVKPCEDDRNLVAPRDTSSSDSSKSNSEASARATTPEPTTIEPTTTTVKGLTVAAKDEALVDYDLQLEYLRDLIVNIAEDFDRLKSKANSEEASVARLLMQRKRAVLKDIVIQTVGMYKSESASPEHGMRDNGPYHRKRLIALGANVTEVTVPTLTHVLAMRVTATIDRVKKDRGDDVNYVHAMWLQACELTWSRLPENWFEAISLLNRYHNLPPRKPWIDCWKIIVENDLKPFDRIQQTVKALGDNNKNDIERPLAIRNHLVTGIYSHGAEIWSPTEHLVLKYDHVESGRLFHALQSQTVVLPGYQPTITPKITPNLHNSNMNPNNTSNTNTNMMGSQRGTRGRTETRWDDDTSYMGAGNMRQHPYESGSSELGARRKRQRQDGSNYTLDDWSIERGPSSRHRSNDDTQRWRPAWSNNNNGDVGGNSEMAPPSWDEPLNDDHNNQHHPGMSRSNHHFPSSESSSSQLDYQSQLDWASSKNHNSRNHNHNSNSRRCSLWDAHPGPLSRNRRNMGNCDFDDLAKSHQSSSVRSNSSNQYGAMHPAVPSHVSSHLEAGQ